MKMILSSCDFINENSKKVILDNIEKPLCKRKVLFIPNEKATSEKIHSNKEVLNILDNSKIYRIDQDGNIMFKIKNNKLKIETCSQ